MPDMDKFASFAAGNWQLFLALFVTLGAILWLEVWGRVRGVSRVGPLQATTLISHEDALVLDVREDTEYRDGHIIDSVHIPLSRLRDRIGELERYRDRTLIVGCRSGHRSARACGRLRKQGFEKVHNLEGGILAWQNANLPLTRKTRKGK